MFVFLIKKDSIKSFTLPSKCYGIYWLTDVDSSGKELPIISIEADLGHWKMVKNSDVFIVENKKAIDYKYIDNYNFYNIYNKKKNEILTIYCTPLYDKSFIKYYIKSNKISIGSSISCDINILNATLPKLQATLIIENKNCKLKTEESQVGTYLNKERVNGIIDLQSGDSIFICGVRIIIAYENDQIILMINNPRNCVKVGDRTLILKEKKAINSNFNDISDYDATVYSENDYYNKKPRFKENIVPLNIEVDAPPAKAGKSDMPVILTVGPMLTGSAITIIYAYMTISNLMKYGGDWSRAWPSFLVCILTLMASLGWPLIIRKYTNHKRKKEEKIRTEKYNIYIQKINGNIENNAKLQKRILIDNSPSLKDCITAIEKRDSNFWNRRVEDEDFLNVNLGSGKLPMQINIKVPTIHFSLDEDELLNKVVEMGKHHPVLDDVPIVYNFLKEKITATVGEYKLNKKFVDSLILQLATLHNYEDIKIVVLTNKRNDSEKYWDYIKVLPHSWSNDKSIHFYGSNKDEIREICYYLDKQFNHRLEDKDKKNNLKLPFYLIVTDNYKEVRNFDFIKKIIDYDDNIGFDLLIMNNKIYDLPPECDTFINVNLKYSELFKNVLNSEVQKFNFDFNTNIDMFKYSQTMANIPILINKEDGSLPDKIGFLELFEAGKIEQLNILNRWRENNPILSLQALVGMGNGGEKIYIDLHEKFHGPHGLIAGMTGSGKSEFIATYILSLAINYHPYEVQFILIDYKGGGLAGIFENSITGVKLPHLIGTITNLETNEISRSLASIESELKRRQKIFGMVREQTGDSVIDIYKYQQLYRDGLVNEPISHLFIISDEFAELKAQQPEFLQQLISISRIGRSLGIHLILATQKPSGVVDNQIWSNSRFRICLRVQEKQDSTEVIKCPDAAFLKNAGRFYFQVGYNETFVLGQAAYGGTKYIPTDKIKHKTDCSIEFLDNVGFDIKKVNMDVSKEDEFNYGEEIKNIVEYLNKLAIDENIKTHNLWLDKMPDYINIDELKKKYDFMKEDYRLDIPVGEYDVPNLQKQGLLTIPFCDYGNVLLYGSNGSGKENFIMTMLYSALTDFISAELVCYIIDCGTNALNIFQDIPQIGDIISVDNIEKVTNLYKFLFYMLDTRKKLFENYNGDYNIYCQNSGKKVPSVLVIINNYDSYVENFSMYDEQLNFLAREGARFGIYFFISVSNPNMIKSKFKQNFKLIYSLQQNNVADYSNILGNVRKKYPSNIFGRGIVAMDDIYEFQTAMISEKNKIKDVIEFIKPLMNERNILSAVKIPVLPKVVTRKDIEYNLTMDGKAIIGVEKDSLNVSKINLKTNFMNLFLSYDISNLGLFLNPFISQLLFVNYFNLIVINAEQININQGNFMYYDSNFDKIFERIHKFVDNNYNKYVENNYKVINNDSKKTYICIIIGFDSFLKKLNMENRNEFQKIMESGKDINAINFILVESVDKMKKYEYDPWYKTVVNNSRGIFFGNGIADQMSIKLSRMDKNLRNDVPYNFCFVVDHGKPTLVKYVENFEINEDI